MADIKIDWDAAIVEMKRRGRCTDVYQNINRNVCMLGAVLATRDLLMTRDIREFGAKRSTLCSEVLEAADLALRPIIKEQFPERFGSMLSTHQFNDHPDTTDEDCFLVFGKARANGS